jgi:hypothetical protein
MPDPGPAKPYAARENSATVSASGASKWMRWAGYIVSALPALALVFGASLKIMKGPDFVKEFVRLGYTESHVVPIGIVELACTIVYLIPQTSVLGAILLTGYLGGATATHVRLEENFVPPVIVGVLVWLGLFLRDPRLRALVPWRS